MKKITCFIGILFLLQLFAVQWIFIGMYQVHQKKVLRRNSSEHIIAIDMHDAILLNSQEIRFKGKLYDIVRREGKKLYCISDEQEESLLSSMDEAAGFSVGVVKCKVNKAKFSFSDYLKSVREFPSPDFTKDPAQIFQPQLIFSKSLSVASPPPDFLS